MTDPMSMFDTASGGQFPLKEHLGDLLVIHVTGFEKDIPTAIGNSDAVRVNILVAEATDPDNVGHESGEEYDDVLLFSKVLVSSLKGKVGTGRLVLGRLGQGQAKPKQDPPWILLPFDEDDAQKAIAAMSGQFASGSEEAAAPKVAPKAAAKAAAKPKVVIPDDKRALAETLVGNGVPEDAIAQATGFTVEQLREAEILPH